MPIIAKNSGGGGDFVQPPVGTHAAVCVDVVDLGMLKVAYAGVEKEQHKIRVCWQIGEDMPDGKPFLASKRYTLSLHEKATLRKELEAWRGRAFTAEEEEGFDVEKLIGVPCLITIVAQAKGDKTYHNVTAIMKPMKNMVPLTPRDYVRMKDRKPDDAKHPEDAQPFAPPIDDDDVPF